MKVKELIQELQRHDGEMDVKFAYETNDYWSTEVARDIQTVEYGYFLESHNGDFDKIVDSEKSDYDKEVLVLSPY